MNSNKVKNINFTEFIFIHFEKEERLENRIWMDPYDSIYLKLISLLFYISEILASMVMFTLVMYEKDGLAGRYRTVTNQLVAYLYGIVRIYVNPKHTRGV